MLRIRSTALVTLALLAVGSAWAQETRLERRVLAMGTSLGLELLGTSQASLQAASEVALAEVTRIEGAISTWRPDSVFNRLNQAQGAAVPLEAEWLGLLELVGEQARRTGGAFDPVLGALVRAWGLREGGAVPALPVLRQARRASGLRHLRLDEAQGTARLVNPAAALEEGAFGKGYALDRAAQKLKEAGATTGLLDFGGQLLAFGKAGFVSLADPRDRTRPRFSIRLENASVSTSGASARGRHILDPRSGQPCADWGSASVVAPSALEADALSTALYVMGPREGLHWATVHHVSVCFLLNDGQTRMSPAFRALAPTAL